MWGLQDTGKRSEEGTVVFFLAGKERRRFESGDYRATHYFNVLGKPRNDHDKNLIFFF
jgi:hypothetical protein